MATQPPRRAAPRRAVAAWPARRFTAALATAASTRRPLSHCRPPRAQHSRHAPARTARFTPAPLALIIAPDARSLTRAHSRPHCSSSAAEQAAQPVAPCALSAQDCSAARNKSNLRLATFAEVSGTRPLPCSCSHPARRAAPRRAAAAWPAHRLQLPLRCIPAASHHPRNHCIYTRYADSPPPPLGRTCTHARTHARTHGSSTLSLL